MQVSASDHLFKCASKGHSVAFWQLHIFQWGNFHILPANKYVRLFVTVVDVHLFSML